MPSVTHVLARYEYKYDPQTWRADIAESFQQTDEDDTAYTVVDGQIFETVETIWEFQSALAEKSPQLPDPPPTFLFADKSYRKDSHYIFQKTHIITTTYTAFAELSYLLVVDDFDVLQKKHTITTRTVDGKIPLAPTVNSALSNLIQQPITMVLHDDCDFIATTEVITNDWLENRQDGETAARRQHQRDTAIVRRIRHPANPQMRIGQTIRVISPKHAVDGRHILVGRAIEIDENGGARQTSDLEFWTR